MAGNVSRLQGDVSLCDPPARVNLNALCPRHAELEFTGRGSTFAQFRCGAPWECRLGVRKFPFGSGMDR